MSQNYRNDVWFLQRVNDESRHLHSELAVGLRRVPDSTFLANSPHHTLAYSETVINDATQYLKESQADAKINNALTAMANASQTLGNAATLQHDKARLMNDAATLLTSAAKSLTLAANARNSYSIVFVYDLEEITMMTRNYISEYLYKFPEINSFLLYTHVESLLHRAKFSGPRELHDGDVINIQNAVFDGTDLMRKIAPKYDALRLLYNQSETFGLPINREVDEEFVARKNNLNHVVEQLQHKTHQRWQSVKRCLDLVNQKSLESPNKFANVVISKEGVAMGAAQLLVSKHAQMIPIENIYSTAKTSINAIFSRIQRRFGKNCMIVYVASPRRLVVKNVPEFRIWRVEAADSIDKLYETQRDLFLQ